MFKSGFPSAFVRWWREVTTYFYSQVDTGSIATSVGLTSASCLVMSYLMLTCTRSKSRFREAASSLVLYCLIGDLCHLAGAFLSNQTSLQCIMGSVMAALDVVRLISVTLRAWCWYHSTAGKKVRMLRKRRRQSALAICLLIGTGGCVYADIRSRYVQAVAVSSATSRKLLNVIVHQDQTELLGYVLGLLSFTISWTSRLPFFLNANRAEMSNPAHVSSRGFSATAGALYASAIVLYDRRLEALLKALPWILSGACGAVLDVSILLLSCYRICYKSPSNQTLDPDTEPLLGRLHRVTSGVRQTLKDSKPRKKISSWKSSSSKMPEIGTHYRNPNVQPVRKVCLKEVTITREGPKSQPVKGLVKVVRVDECYSSGSATDSSCFSSELEWDFEETPPQWSSRNRDGQKTASFPLQDWAPDQRSKSNTRSSSSGCFCNSADLGEKISVISGSPETNVQSFSDSVK